MMTAIMDLRKARPIDAFEMKKEVFSLKYAYASWTVGKEEMFYINANNIKSTK